MKKTYSVGLQTDSWVAFHADGRRIDVLQVVAEQATDALQHEFEQAVPELGPVCGVSLDGRLSIRLEVSVSDPYVGPVFAISRAQSLASRVLKPRVVEFLKLDVEPVDA